MMMDESLTADDNVPPAVEPSRDRRRDTVDLTDSSLLVDISDALSERDKVKFTVHTKTTLSEFQRPEFSVVRQHEEFIWLHDRFSETAEYAGYLLPPAPPRPDFDASRDKLQKLGEGEGILTKEEFQKLKQELEAEYLATFKKTVAMHEIFLQRLAGHPVLRADVNYRVFLEYENDLSVRQKNKRERLGGLVRTIQESVDKRLVSSQNDSDEFFETERKFLLEFHVKVRDATVRADKVVRAQKNVAEKYIKIGGCVADVGGLEEAESRKKIYIKFSEILEKERKLEARVASDADLKLADTLRYYMRDAQAAKDLLYRRLRKLADYEAANKNLEKARAKNKEIQQAEEAQQLAADQFENISRVAKQELVDFRNRRVAAFKKNLVELAELEIKHSKAQLQLLRSCIDNLKA